MKKFKAAAFLTVFLAFVCVFSLSALAKGIAIMHTNDTHGRFVTGSGIIGIDRIASIKKAAAGLALLVDAGDTFHGLPFATINKGADAVELMNLAGYDVFTPGNHDFNYGWERLVELQEMAEFDFLSSNVKKDGQHLFSATTIKEVDGVKVGFFGVSTPETLFKSNPLNTEGLLFDDIAACAAEAIAELNEQGADIIVAVAHLGTDESSEETSIKLAESVPGIDLIVDGHSHSLYEEGLWVGDTLIVSAKEYEAYVGLVEIELDDDNNVLGMTASVIDYQTAIDNFEPDEAVSAKMEEILDAQGEILDVKVADLTYTMSSERDPGVRTQEMPLGNLAADALKAGTNAEIAMTNGGGLRADLNEGPITVGDIIAVLPFGNYGVTKYITPVQLKEILENGVAAAPASAGKFPQVSGFSFVYDPTQPVGSRVISITMDDGIDLSFDDSTSQLLFATNDFIAVGGDEYTMLKDVKTENEFSALDEMLLAYIVANPDKVYDKPEGRVTVFEGAAPALVPAEEDKKDVESAPSTPAASGTATVVDCYALNVRAGHGVSYNVISSLRVGDVVTVLDTYKNWVQITDGVKTGWVYSKYLKIN